MSEHSTPRTTAATPLQSHLRKPVVIAGAGLIGLSIALELQRRNCKVTVLESGKALQQASIAAAGMLASEDPHNPPQLLALARYSRSLYPKFLGHIEELSGMKVPLQTRVTVQHLPVAETSRLDEDSLDPRQLSEALLAATHAAGIDLRENCAETETGDVTGRTLVIAAGAWSGTRFGKLQLPVEPRKGQMMRVALPPGLRALREVHRSEAVYVVPRTQGPRAGTALVGATVENAGFDTTAHRADLIRLRLLASELIPELASEGDAPMIEAWAGLRPATPDELPLLGWSGETLVATGHFRNGILLAPATAVIIADLIEGREPAVHIEAFSPRRLAG